MFEQSLSEVMMSQVQRNIYCNMVWIEYKEWIDTGIWWIEFKALFLTFIHSFSVSIHPTNSIYILLFTVSILKTNVQVTY